MRNPRRPGLIDYSGGVLANFSSNSLFQSITPTASAKTNRSSIDRKEGIAYLTMAVTVGSVIPFMGEALAYADGNIQSPLSTDLASVQPSNVHSQGEAPAALMPELTPEESSQVQFVSQRYEANSVVQPGDSSPSTVASNADNCEESICKGLEFIDDQLPEVEQRIQELRFQMQQFQGENADQNLQTYQAVLAHRMVDIAQQKVEVGQYLSAAELELLELQTLLSMQPYEANFAANLLSQDARYQDGLQQLADVDRQIAVEFSHPELNQSQLEVLYSQYQQISDQLHYDAHDILSRFLAISQVQATNPLWQEQTYYELLSNLVSTTHHQIVLLQRQDTINYIETLLQQRQTHLAQSLREYSTLHRQLEAETQVLQDYITRRQALLIEENQPQFSSPLSSGETLPESHPIKTSGQSPLNQVWQFLSEVPYQLQGEIALALLMGGGILTAFAAHQQGKEPALKNFQLYNPEPELVDPDIQLPTLESVSLISIFKDYTEKDFEIFSAMAIAVVLQAFKPKNLKPDILPIKLFSELNQFAKSPISLPIDDIDLYANDAIDMALNGLSFDAHDNTEGSRSIESEEIKGIFDESPRPFILA